MAATPHNPAAPVPVVPPNQPTSWVAWLGRVAPSALVLVALGGLACWGHFSGWKLPKIAALTGSHQAADKDWCDEHSVAESECVE